MKTVKKN